MYKQYLKICPSKNGSGVFATAKIPSEVPVIEITGQILSEKDLPDPNHPAIIQVGKDSFIGPSGDVDDYINHSCDPNCKIHIVGNRAILYSLYDIQIGMEVTFDYSTSSTDTLDKWKMDCQCGKYNCRKIISGLQYVDSSIIKDYKKRNIIPLFLAHPMFKT